MKKILFTLLLFVLNFSFLKPQVKFAAIGDFGKAGSNELNVSNLVKSWNPEFIITLGDNNYELGEAATIDLNIGQYYHQFISPYTGNYGQGDSVNRFFPSLGNHDWYTLSAQAYLNYFALPSNERYYDFVKGNVHFFAIDSDPNEPDGVDSSSVQGQWLKMKLSQSTEKYNLVYFHHPPYSSAQHGSQHYMQWPFKEWGATAVLAGHDHTYERIFIDSLTYFVNGLGGKSIYAFNTPVPGSQLRYNNNYGAMLIMSYDDSLVFRFYSVSGNQRDYYKILPSPKKLELTSYIQGFYDPAIGFMIRDTLKVFLRDYSAPYAIVDSAKGYLDPNGRADFNFINASNATNYYIVLMHRNSIETWSSPVSFFHTGNLSYDFSTSASQAYGDNLILKGTKYCIYSGDTDQDGDVDAQDLSLVENDVLNFVQGYVNSDIDGNNIVNASDLGIVDNNVFMYVSKISP